VAEVGVTAVLEPTEVLDADSLPAGYYRDRWYGTVALMTLPWPERVEDLPVSLGPSLIAWAEWRTYAETGVPGLINHQTGDPWSFTPGQRRFLHQWYAFDPETGRWLFRRGVKRGAKGTGKDPFGAAWCILELIGAVRLTERDGVWVGERHRVPLVQIASNSSDQSKDVLRVANAMLPAETREYFSIDTGETRTILKDTGGRLEVLTASEESSEGDPATAIFMNETHHMTKTNGGHKVAKVARRNVGKSPAYLQARMLDATNAHLQGEESVAEQTYAAWQLQAEGKAARRDILYDSIEAPPQTDMMDEASRQAGLRAAYCDAPWADLDRLEGEMLDPETPVADSVRYYLNGLGDREDAWVSPGKVIAQRRQPPDGEALCPPGAQIAMFLDCSKSFDTTGLVGCRLSDGFTFEIGSWAKPPGDRGRNWLAPRELVDAKVRTAFEVWKPEWFGVDPSPAKDDSDEALYWQAVIDGWHRDFRKRLRVWATPGNAMKTGNSVLFDMRIKTLGGPQRNEQFTVAAMRLAREVDEEGVFRWAGSARMLTHFLNARRRPNPWGVSLGKVTRDSSAHVDLAVCAVGANMGRRIVLNSGKVRQRSGEAAF
jgi:hypothetical protein